MLVGSGSCHSCCSPERRHVQRRLPNLLEGAEPAAGGKQFSSPECSDALACKSRRANQLQATPRAVRRRLLQHSPSTWLQNSGGTPASTSARMPAASLFFAHVRMDSGAKRRGGGCAMAATKPERSLSSSERRWTMACGGGSGGSTGEAGELHRSSVDRSGPQGCCASRESLQTRAALHEAGPGRLSQHPWGRVAMPIGSDRALGDCSSDRKGVKRSLQHLPCPLRRSQAW